MSQDIPNMLAFYEATRIQSMTAIIKVLTASSTDKEQSGTDNVKKKKLFVKKTIPKKVVSKKILRKSKSMPGDSTKPSKEKAQKQIKLNPFQPPEKIPVAPPKPPCTNEKYNWLLNKMYPKAITKCYKLMDLPQQLRTKIIRYVPPMQRLSLQDVCRQLLFEVRSRVGIAVKINENTITGPTFMRDVQVESIYISKFFKPVLHPLRMIFRPENIMEFKICGPISLQILDAFLQRLKGIKLLKITGPIFDSMSPTASKAHCLTTNNRYRWRKFDSIVKFPNTLGSLLELYLILPGIKATDYLDYIILLFRLPVLKRLIVHVTGRVESTQTAWVHYKVLNLLKVNRTIDEVTLSTEPKIDPSTWSPLTAIPVARSDSLLTTLRLKHIVLLELRVNFDTWLPVLLNQTHLKIFKVLHLTYWALQRRIIENNVKYLKKVSIHTLLEEQLRDKMTHLDLSVFRRCYCLKELYICVADPIIPGSSDIINFNRLPRNLTILAIRNGAIKTRELFKILNLPKLSSLGLINIINADSYGFTTELITGFLWIRSLNELALSDGTLEEINGGRPRPSPFKRMFAVISLLDAKIFVPKFYYKSLHVKNGKKSCWSIDPGEQGYEFKFNTIH